MKGHDMSRLRPNRLNLSVNRCDQKRGAYLLGLLGLLDMCEPRTPSSEVRDNPRCPHQGKVCRNFMSQKGEGLDLEQY